MSLRPPAARSAVAPFYVMEIFGAAEERRRRGLPVYNLAAGQPSSGAPEPVRAAAMRAVSSHRIGYGPALGLPELREAIAQHTRRWYGVDVAAEDVVVTTGSSGAFLLAFLAAFDAGAVVAMGRPGYPAYRNILSSLGCVVEEFDCGAEFDFIPSVEQVQALQVKPDGLILASPANPTGAMLGPERLDALARWCSDNSVRLISDEIYHGISFSSPAATAWQFNRDAVVVNSFSKYFSMTGWRLGWLLVPPALADAVDRLTGNYTICPPTLSQLAALAAFDCYPELDAHVARYAANRAMLLKELPAIGLTRLAPADGAFYVYADVSDHTDDSLSWVRQVLRDTGVALAPGIDFDTRSGARFARLSFAGESGEIEQAVEVLAGYLS